MKTLDGMYIILRITALLPYKGLKRTAMTAWHTFRQVFSQLLLVFVVVGSAWGAGNETINPLPATNPDASSYSRTRIMLQNEIPDILGRSFPPWTYSGGLHGTAAGCTSGSFSTEAFTSTGNRVTANSVGGSAAIAYSAVGCNCDNPGSDTAFVVISGATGDALGNFQRVSGTNYFVNCTDAAPALPDDSAWLMQVTVTNGAIAAVQDRRRRFASGIDSVERYGSLAAAVDEYDDVGDPQVTLLVASMQDVSTTLTVPGNMALQFHSGGRVRVASGQVLHFGACPQAGRWQIFDADGVTTGSIRFLRGACLVVYPEWWGAVADGTSTAAAPTTDNYLAFKAVIEAVKDQFRPATIRLGSGLYWVNGQIVLYDYIQLHGDGPNNTFVYYSGSLVQDFVVTADSTQDEGIQLHDLALGGGRFNQGHARYVLYADTFQRHSGLYNVSLSQGLGALRLNTSHYSNLSNVRLGPNITLQSVNGATGAQYNEVYGIASAPVYFSGNAMTIDKLQVTGIITLNDGGGATPENAVYIAGGSGTINDMTVESTINSVEVALRVIGRWTFAGLYAEDVTVGDYFLMAYRRAFVTVLNPSFFNFMIGDTLFRAEGLADIRVIGMLAWGMDFARAWGSPGTGYGLGTHVTFEECTWSSGSPRTFASFNADTSNVFDTLNTNHPLGTPEPTLIQFQARRRYLPQVNTGLVVSSGTESGVAYIAVTGGVLQAEDGRFYAMRIATGTAFQGGSTNVVAQVLRPTTASKWYRVWIGQAGNVFLEQYDVEPTDPKGNWLAEFQTDGSTLVTGLVTNPVLSLTGGYLPGTSTRQVLVTAVPATTDKRWTNGDQAINSDPDTGEFAVAVFDATAATWRTIATVP